MWVHNKFVGVLKMPILKILISRIILLNSFFEGKKLLMMRKVNLKWEAVF